MIQDWGGKPYYSLDHYCKNTYGKKLYKIALDGGFTCPNRDGTLDKRGCIFCSEGGSGEFAVPLKGTKTREEMDDAISRGLSLFRSTKRGDAYIGYFQSYTGTYAPPKRLYALYSCALSHEKIAGISIATRPDCLGEEVLAVLDRLKKEYPHKFIWIELGLQTVHETTAAYIRRGYGLSVFEDAVKRLQERDIPLIVHVILGLPGETPDRSLETICYVNQFTPFGIKLQLLHILKGTDLAEEYEKGLISVYSKEEYLSLLSRCIAALNPETVIHRITGDGPKKLLVAPEWSANKRDVLNSFHRFCKENGRYQGKDFEKYKRFEASK